MRALALSRIVHVSCVLHQPPAACVLSPRQCAGPTHCPLQTQPAAVVCPANCTACSSASKCNTCAADFTLLPSGSCGGWMQMLLASVLSTCQTHLACLFSTHIAICRLQKSQLCACRLSICLQTISASCLPLTANLSTTQRPAPSTAPPARASAPAPRVLVALHSSLAVCAVGGHRHHQQYTLRSLHVSAT